MPIARKQVPQDFLDQMKSNLTKDSPVEVTEEPEAATGAAETEKAVPEKKIETVVKEVKTEKKIETQPASDDKKEKYADVMNVRLSKGRRNEIKTFCTSCGISVTQYIETSFEYLAKEVAAGRLVISKGGITKKVE